MLRASLPAIGALVASLALPAAVPAAEVGVVGEEKRGCTGYACEGQSATSLLVFRAAPGEANRVRYAFEPGKVVFTESGGAPLTAGPSCAERQPGTVACDIQIAEITVETGDGADVVEPQGAPTRRILINGGAGDDVLVGGAGDDTIDGGGGRDELHGGGGRWDTLDDGDGPQGDADVLDGGPGGRDEVSYRGRTDDLEVDLDRSAGPDGDRLTGFESAAGGAGDDRLFASSRSTGYFDGGKGRDTLRGRARNDYLFGGEGRDALVGGAGDDELTGGGGRDRVSGGPGRDDLLTADGTSERVRCGSGRDFVGDREEDDFDGDVTEYGPDAGDRLAADCETILTNEGRYIPAQPLRVGPGTLLLRNACRPCSKARVTVRIGNRVAARGRLAGRRTEPLAWRRMPARGRRVTARITWRFADRFSEYAYTLRLRIP